MKRIIVIYLAVIAMVAGVIIVVPRLAKPTVPRPITAVAILRLCDFVTFLPDTFAVCDDGTRWGVELLSGVKEIEGIGNPIDQAVPRDVQLDGERTVVSVDDADGEEMTIRYSRYFPALGGPNCANFQNGKCISKMASGLPWEDYIDKAVACPKEWPFNTRVTLDGKTWICLDRGGQIKIVDGIPWVDFMVEKGAYKYGTLVQARVRFVR